MYYAQNASCNAYNQLGQPKTRLGNWYEERALLETTGGALHAKKKEGLHVTGHRVLAPPSASAGSRDKAFATTYTDCYRYNFTPVAPSSVAANSDVAAGNGDSNGGVVAAASTAPEYAVAHPIHMHANDNPQHLPRLRDAQERSFLERARATYEADRVETATRAAEAAHDAMFAERAPINRQRTLAPRPLVLPDGSVVPAGVLTRVPPITLYDPRLPACAAAGNQASVEASSAAAASTTQSSSSQPQAFTSQYFTGQTQSKGVNAHAKSTTFTGGGGPAGSSVTGVWRDEIEFGHNNERTYVHPDQHVHEVREGRVGGDCGDGSGGGNGSSSIVYDSSGRVMKSVATAASTAAGSGGASSSSAAGESLTYSRPSGAPSSFATTFRCV